MQVLTLKTEAGNFVVQLSDIQIAELYGITDGKAVGTYVTHIDWRQSL